jgi:hypothetical protein
MSITLAGILTASLVVLIAKAASRPVRAKAAAKGRRRG